MSSNECGKTHVLVAGIIIITLLLFSCTGNKKTAMDAIAVVNGDIIAKKEFTMAMKMTEKRFAEIGQPIDDAKRKELEDTVLNRLINEALLYQKCKEKNITVSEITIDKNLEQAWMNFTGKAEFDELMRSIGLTDAEVRERIRQESIIQKFIDDEITPTVTITENDVETHYNENPDRFKIPERLQARQIVIKINKDENGEKRAAALKKIKMLQEKIKNGKDFAALAKEYSEGPSAEIGGDMGVFGPGDLVKPLEEVAYALKPGEVSDAVESPWGYHLIKLERRIPPSSIPFNDVKSKIENYLKRERVEKAVRDYTETLKAGSTIKKYL